MSNNKRQVWLPVLLSVSLIIGMVFGYKLHENMGDFAPKMGKKNQLNNQISEVLALIESKYVDTLTADSLKQHTIEALIDRLDPHSSYIPAEEIDAMNEDLQGNYHGIGIQYEIIKDTVTILSIFDASPAAKAGLQIGDQIIKADTVQISGKKLKDAAVNRIVRGQKESSITLHLLRNYKTLTLTIERNKIFSGNIDAAYMIAPEIAYLRISSFAENTYEEFMEQVEKLKDLGMQKMILDLRDNGGGVLDDAVQIADEFLDGNKEIVSTKGAKMPLERYAARRPGLFEKGQLIVLINEHSASASEVLAGAIQDWNRGTLIGRRSFGKGLVQEQFSLSDGSALRLTVARYYTPLGRCIQKPYRAGIDSPYTSEIMQRMNDGELFYHQNTNHKGKLFATSDGRKLYSEEGISPDIFVPADSVSYMIYEQNSNLQENLTQIALAFYKKHSQQIATLSDHTQLTALLMRDAQVIESINGLQLSQQTRQIADKQKRLANEVSYILAWMIWRESGYLKMYNINDRIVNKALTLMQQR
jgi:carboxyl-terminal processing protease